MGKKRKTKKPKPPVHDWEHFGFRPELTCAVCGTEWVWDRDKEPRGECTPRPCY